MIISPPINWGFVSDLITSFHGVLDLPARQAALWGVLASFLACLTLVLTKRWHGAFTLDDPQGIQKFHTDPTPRIGGISILLSLIVVWGKSTEEVRQFLTPMLFAGLPAFLFGLAEDITKKISVNSRLLATMGSGLLACWLTDYSLTRVDLWGADELLRWGALSLLFTAFAVGGVANAVNIIDGFNGLAGMTTMLAFIGYAMIAFQVGDTTLASVALVYAACVFGFFWVNWPLGKIFLGDGGSYFIGFSLAWVAVLLLERHPSVSVFAVLLPCIHPVVEVLFSIYRRRIRKEHPGMPDRLHFHSLVKRRYVARWFGDFSAPARNSMTGVLVGLLTLVAVVVANLVYLSHWMSVAAVMGLALGYVAIYARMVKHRWCSPLHFLFVRLQ